MQSVQIVGLQYNKKGKNMKKLVYAMFVSILVCGNNIVVDFNNETYCEDFNITFLAYVYKTNSS